MSRCTHEAAVRVARLTLWLAGVGLGGVSCRDQEIAGPDEASAPTGPAALSTAATTALSFRQVSAGNDHTCGVTAANRVYCWGSNFYGELGDGTTTQRSSPVPVSGT
jgi:alpha-tubulin suppressor-like RCC1 family protein